MRDTLIVLLFPLFFLAIGLLPVKLWRRKPMCDNMYPAWSPLSAGEFRGYVQDAMNQFGSIQKTLAQIGKIMAASQSDIDALTTAVNDLATTVAADDSALNTAVTAIQAELDALKAQGVDVSNLQTAVTSAQSAVSDLGTAVSGVQSLVPPATS